MFALNAVIQFMLVGGLLWQSNKGQVLPSCNIVFVCVYCVLHNTVFQVPVVKTIEGEMNQSDIPRAA